MAYHSSHNIMEDTLLTVHTQKHTVCNTAHSGTNTCHKMLVRQDIQGKLNHSSDTISQVHAALRHTLL